MPIDSYQILKIGLGVLSLGGGLWLTIKSAIDRNKLCQIQDLHDKASKCNLNQTSIRKQKQSSNLHSTFLNGRPVSIQKVIAHFMNNEHPYVNFKSGKNDDFAKIQCSPFFVVEKTFNKHEWQYYQVDAKDTLVSKNLLMRDQSIYEASKHDMKKIVPYLLTSASTMGIIGSLKLSSDSSQYVIQAKVIGVDLKQIQKYISDEVFYKTFGIVAGCGLIIIGGVWLWKTWKDIQRARVPLQASLLDKSKVRR